MTLLDLLCDSREDRFLSGRWKAMTAFGQLFHRSLAEEGRDPWADRFEADPDGFRRACLALGGTAIPLGDLGFSFPVFRELTVRLKFYGSDEDFPASVVLLWDENMLQYVYYETVFYIAGFLLHRILEQMDGLLTKEEPL